MSSECAAILLVLPYLKIMSLQVMNILDLTRQDIDQLIRNFRVHPNSNDYFNIQTWYENNIQHYPDQEYIICVYLFLPSTFSTITLFAVLPTIRYISGAR